MARTLTLTAAILGACAAPTAVPEPPTPLPPTAAPPATEPQAAPPPPPVVTVPPVTVGGAGVATTSPPPPPVESSRDDAFWRRLADCECASGRCGGVHVSYFQFSADTALKVGIDGSEPYEEQRAAAVEWARRIHPREGTSAGWPHCWWVAAA